MDGCCFASGLGIIRRLAELANCVNLVNKIFAFDESAGVRKKKKGLETQLDSKEEEELFEKRRNSVEVPICFSEGRRVSVL